MSGRLTPSKSDVERCAHYIAQGGVAVVPTDTLYGLAASITHPKAVECVLRIKERSAQQGMPVLLASAEQASQVGEAPRFFAELGAAFWPGGLTLVVKARPVVHRGIMDNRGTVAVRVPGMYVTRELARLVGTPLTGTSANPRRQQPPASAEEARSLLGKSIDCVLDGGHVGGTPSTIIDLTTDPICLIRTGAVPVEEIRRIVPELASQGMRASDTE